MALIAYLAAIYGTLAYVRVVSNFLRDAGLLRITVVALFAVAAVVWLAVVVRDPRNRSWKAGALLLASGSRTAR